MADTQKHTAVRRYYSRALRRSQALRCPRHATSYTMPDWRVRMTRNRPALLLLVGAQNALAQTAYQLRMGPAELLKLFPVVGLSMGSRKKSAQQCG